MSKLNITMIKMYEEMIENDFEPIEQNAKNVLQHVEAGILKEAKLELGLYDLLLEETSLKEQLNTVQDRIYALNRNQWDSNTNSWGNILDQRVKEITHKRYPFLDSIQCKKNTLIREIKLAGVSETIADTFKALPALLATIGNEFQAVTKEILADAEAEKTKAITE